MKFIHSKDFLEKEDPEAEDASEDVTPSSKKRAQKVRVGKVPPSAQTTAFRMISMRDYSSKILREKLSEKGFSQEEILQTLEFLREKRFLDDLRYGRNLIRYMAERRYFGAYKIRMELSLKLDREYIEKLLPEVFENYDFAALAKELISKPQLRGKSREALIRKLKANGYGAQEIRSALSDVQSAEE